MAQSGSFIPQQQGPRRTPVRGRRVYILNYIVYTIFIGVILTTAGLLVWQFRLESTLGDQQAQLEQQRNSFSQSDIARVQEMENMLGVVSYLLDRQPAFTNLLTALEETTIDPVYIRNFKVETDANQTDQVIVTYTGVSDSFDTVLALREVMRAHPLLQQGTIVDITYGQDTAQNTEDEPDTPLTAAMPISYEVTLMFPVRDVLYDGRNVDTNSTSPVTEVPEVATTTAPAATSTVTASSSTQ